MSVQIAAWLIILVVGGWLFMTVIGNPLIDWLDRRTSHITDEDARHRAQLSLIGRWPPRERPWRQPLDWILLGAGLLIIALVSLAFRFLKQ